MSAVWPLRFSVANIGYTPAPPEGLRDARTPTPQARGRTELTDDRSIDRGRERSTWAMLAQHSAGRLRDAPIECLQRIIARGTSTAGGMTSALGEGRRKRSALGFRRQPRGEMY